MVKLNKIYTKTGDGGETGLVGTTRIAKHSLRMEAIGDVDEANAAIGMARLYTEGEADDMLARIQQDLFDLGADLATLYPAANNNQENKTTPQALRITESQVARLETEIDAMNADIPPLASFILPGGTPAAACLHLARTIIRRAERAAFGLATTEQVNPQALHYLNRLSDHCFVLCRFINDHGAHDVLWQPGVNR